MMLSAWICGYLVGMEAALGNTSALAPPEIRGHVEHLRRFNKGVEAAYEMVKASKK
jgi:hypothetical protein